MKPQHNKHAQDSGAATDREKVARSAILDSVAIVSEKRLRLDIEARQTR